MAAPLTPGSVLLVDDRPENLLALEAVLAPLGCRLERATSGDEALKALLHEDFAVIVLDVQMPGLDGFETAEIIRDRERTRLVPIIFVTAISKEAHHVFRGYSAGAVDYVVKPFDPVVLRSKVEIFLELHERGRVLAEREELLRATFEDAPIGMARGDAGGRLLRVNAALCTMLGRPEAELLGRTLDELGPAEEGGIDDAQRAELLAGGSGRYEVERRLAGRGGATVPVLVSVSCTRSPDAPAADLVIGVVDLSDRRRAESRRAQLERSQAARARAEAASERLRMTDSIAGAALGAESLDDLLRELLDRVVDALGADRAAIALTGVDGRRGLARAADRTDVHAAPGAVDDVVDRVVRERDAVATADVPASGEGTSLGPDVASLVAVPFAIDGEVLGCLQAGSLAPRVFDADAVDLLRLGADRAGLAIARTQLRERERRIGQQLQHSLLPRTLPEVPGVVAGARYEPGAQGTEVGGDWYDAFALPGGRIALAIGDVVGRGIEAAATMGQMRSALRAILMQDEDTGIMADRLNRFALGLGESVMTTVVIAVLEPATGRLRYTNAGHPPALLLDPAGGPRFLEGAPSPPLGVVPAPRYPQQVAMLDPGAILVLYTDGLVEQPREVLDVGFARLAAACEEPGEDVEVLCDRILGRVHTAWATPDDVTLLVVRTLERLGTPLRLEASGRPAAQTAMRAAVQRWLAEADVGEREAYDITLACTEACQNAIEHAYGMSDDPFEMCLELDGDALAVTVTDSGRWKDHPTPGRGRGLPLMRSLMDEVDVQPGPRGTTVVMRKRLAGAGPVAVSGATSTGRAGSGRAPTG